MLHMYNICKCYLGNWILVEFEVIWNWSFLPNLWFWFKKEVLRNCNILQMKVWNSQMWKKVSSVLKTYLTYISCQSLRKQRTKKVLTLSSQQQENHCRFSKEPRRFYRCDTEEVRVIGSQGNNKNQKSSVLNQKVLYWTKKVLYWT